MAQVFHPHIRNLSVWREFRLSESQIQEEILEGATEAPVEFDGL